MSEYIDHVSADDPHWLDWEIIKTLPPDPPPTMPPPRAPEIMAVCAATGADPTTYGQLDPQDQQAMRTDALNRIADRLGDIGKELSRLVDEVRANA